MSTKRVNCFTAMKRKKDAVTGQFYSDGEAIADKITFRVPPSLREEAEALANGNLAEWLRQAMAEKIKNEKSQNAC